MNVLGALSDLPLDDPYIRGEFQAIKDTVLENKRAGGLKDLVGAGSNVSSFTLIKYPVYHGP